MEIIARDLTTWGVETTSPPRQCQKFKLRFLRENNSIFPPPRGLFYNNDTYALELLSPVNILCIYKLFIES